MNKTILILSSMLVIPGVLAVGETVSTLDKILSFLIPVVMIGLFGMMMYKAFKEPFDKLFAWIRESIRNKRENSDYTPQTRYKSGYMFPGDVGYMR